MKKLSYETKADIALFSLLVVFLLAVSRLASVASNFGASEVPSAAAHDSSVVAVKSSATNQGSANNSTAMLVSSQATICYGFHLSSATIPAGLFVVVRDTDSAQYALDVPTKTMVGFSTSDQRIQFNPPLRFNKGLNVNSTGCNQSASGWCYTVLYDTIP